MRQSGDPLLPAEPFPDAARRTVRDGQLRANLRRATGTIREKRAEVTSELPDWAELRASGRAVKDATLAELDRHLVALEARVKARGGTVHWARDAREARAIVLRLVQATGTDRVIKVKSLTTEEIALNDHLIANGISPIETDLAELIIQMAGEKPSHILVPAIHKNRAEIRDLFAREMQLPDLTDDPAALTRAARAFLRSRFLETSVGVSGANFAIAETGSLVVVESEGNGRMCLTLPRVLVSVIGIEKVLPTWQDLEVFLQLLPRSATGERMNPYTTIFHGVHPGDGPETLHLVLVDHGRTRALQDPDARSALRCIRCSACLNVCPVYERVGGHAYGSVYPGPIGSVITPYLTDAKEADTLPYASSLCGACADVCPVEIPLPDHLVRLRAHAVTRKEETLKGRLDPETLGMRALARVFADPARYARAQRIPRAIGERGMDRIASFPGAGLTGWTRVRDLPPLPRESFRELWQRTHPDETSSMQSDASPGPDRGHAAGAGASPIAADPPPTSPMPEGSRASNAEASDAGDARTVVLGRIRRALRDDPPVPAIPRRYRIGTDLSRGEIVARFVGRLADYGAGVTRVRNPPDAAGALRDLLVGIGIGEAAVPHDLAPDWMAAVPRPHIDGPGSRLTYGLLEDAPAVVTGCRLGIAETGTLVLDAGPGQGRRALSLLPDLHVCLVGTDQVRPDVPTAVRDLERGPGWPEGPRGPLTWISGPSATADIEFRRVQGVHGPRRLEVILYGPDD